jgi:hypothetical protein
MVKKLASVAKVTLLQTSPEFVQYPLTNCSRRQLASFWTKQLVMYRRCRGNKKHVPPKAASIVGRGGPETSYS